MVQEQKQNRASLQRHEREVQFEVHFVVLKFLKFLMSVVSAGQPKNSASRKPGTSRGEPDSWHPFGPSVWKMQIMDIIVAWMIECGCMLDLGRVSMRFDGNLDVGFFGCESLISDIHRQIRYPLPFAWTIEELKLQHAERALSHAQHFLDYQTRRLAGFGRWKHSWQAWGNIFENPQSWYNRQEK